MTTGHFQGKHIKKRRDYGVTSGHSKGSFKDLPFE
jgi:hypothetical protein